MDWNRIEKEISFHADHVSRKSNSFNLNVPLRELNRSPSKPYTSFSEEKFPSFYQTGFNSNNVATGPDTNIAMITTLSNEISDMRNLMKKYTTKMNNIEHSLKITDDNHESSRKYTEEMTGKIEDLQYSLNDSKALNHELNRQNDDLFMKVRKLEAQLQSLEESQMEVATSYTSKETFSKYLDTTIDQFQSLATVSEVARNKSGHAITLFESLLVALFNLNSQNRNNNSANFRAEYLAVLSAAASANSNDNSPLHREQLTRLLTDAIQSAITLATREHLSATVQTLNSNISAAIADLYSRQELSYKQLNEKFEHFSRENGSVLEETRQLVSNNSFYGGGGVNGSVLQVEGVMPLGELSAEHKALKELVKRIEMDTKYLRENQSIQRSLTDELLASQKTHHTASNTLTSGLAEESKENRDAIAAGETVHQELRASIDELNNRMMQTTEQFHKHLELVQQNKDDDRDKLSAGKFAELIAADKAFAELKKECESITEQLDTVQKRCGTSEHEAKQMSNKLTVCCDTVSSYSGVIDEYMGAVSKQSASDATEAALKEVSAKVAQCVESNFKLSNRVDTLDSALHHEVATLSNEMRNKLVVNDDACLKLSTRLLKNEQNTSDQRQALTDLEASLGTQSRLNGENHTTVTNKIAAVQSECKDQLTRLSDDLMKLTKQTIHLESDLKYHVEHLVSDGKAKASDFFEQISKMNSKLNAIDATNSSTIDHNTTSLRTKLSDSLETIAQLTRRLDAQDSEFASRLQQHSDKSEQKHQQLADKTEQKLQQCADRLEAVDSKVTTKCDQMYNDITGKVDSTIDRSTAAMTKRVDGLEAEQGAKIASGIAELRESLTKLSKRFEELETETKAKFDTVQNNMADISAANSNAVSALSGKVESNLMQSVTNFASLDTQLVGMNKHTEHSLSQIAQQLCELSDTQNTQQAELVEDFKYLEKHLSDKVAVVAEEHKQTTTQLSALQSEYQQHFRSNAVEVEDLRYDLQQCGSTLELLERQLSSSGAAPGQFNSDSTESPSNAALLARNVGDKRVPSTPSNFERSTTTELATMRTNLSKLKQDVDALLRAEESKPKTSAVVVTPADVAAAAKDMQLYTDNAVAASLNTSHEKREKLRTELIQYVDDSYSSTAEAQTQGVESVVRLQKAVSAAELKHNEQWRELTEATRKIDSKCNKMEESIVAHQRDIDALQEEMQSLSDTYMSQPQQLPLTRENLSKASSPKNVPSLDNHHRQSNSMLQRHSDAMNERDGDGDEIKFHQMDNRFDELGAVQVADEDDDDDQSTEPDTPVLHHHQIYDAEEQDKQAFQSSEKHNKSLLDLKAALSPSSVKTGSVASPMHAAQLITQRSASSSHSPLRRSIGQIGLVPETVTQKEEEDDDDSFVSSNDVSDDGEEEEEEGSGRGEDSGDEISFDSKRGGEVKIGTMLTNNSFRAGSTSSITSPAKSTTNSVNSNIFNNTNSNSGNNFVGAEKIPIALSTSVSGSLMRNNSPRTGHPSLTTGSLLGRASSGSSVNLNTGSGKSTGAESRPIYMSLADSSQSEVEDNKDAKEKLSINTSDNNNTPSYTNATLQRSNSVSSIGSGSGNATNRTPMLSKEESVQCLHCLRRIARNEFNNHNKTCELRLELCSNGCGTKVRLAKMSLHLQTCTHRPEDGSSTTQNNQTSTSTAPSSPSRPSPLPGPQLSHIKLSSSPMAKSVNSSGLNRGLPVGTSGLQPSGNLGPMSSKGEESDDSFVSDESSDLDN